MDFVVLPFRVANPSVYNSFKSVYKALVFIFSFVSKIKLLERYLSRLKLTTNLKFYFPGEDALLMSAL
jgi:Fe-S oxidoreductase